MDEQSLRQSVIDALEGEANVDSARMGAGAESRAIPNGRAIGDHILVG